VIVERLVLYVLTTAVPHHTLNNHSPCHTCFIFLSFQSATREKGRVANYGP